MKKKIKSCAGETLVETVVSILLVSLVAAALGAMIMAARDLNVLTKNSDEAFYEQSQELNSAISSTNPGEPPALPDPVGPDGGEKNLIVQFLKEENLEAAPLHESGFQVYYYLGESNRLVGYAKK